MPLQYLMEAVGGGFPVAPPPMAVTVGGVHVHAQKNDAPGTEVEGQVDCLIATIGTVPKHTRVSLQTGLFR